VRERPDLGRYDPPDMGGGFIRQGFEASATLPPVGEGFTLEIAGQIRIGIT
jgi:hypothetical protein